MILGGHWRDARELSDWRMRLCSCYTTYTMYEDEFNIK